MLLVLSPAKTLDFTPPPEGTPASERRMAADSAALVRAARKLKAADLKRLMGISDTLAELNRERFKALDAKALDVGVQAALAFAGDVYEGLDARTLNDGQLGFAQDHVRILSGLYGLLRPLDRIQPYRLEMGVRLATPRGETLYEFWGPRIAKALNADAAGHADPTVVNLASQEYFGAVDRKALKPPVLTCRFLEEKDGEAKIIAFYAKAARGLMARYAVENRIERAADLKGFDARGYSFRPGLSGEGDWVFARPQPAAMTKKAA